MARAIAVGAENDVRHAGLDLTATRCSGCPRQTYLETQMEYRIDPSKAAVRVRGTVLHDAAARLFDPELWYTEETDPVRLTIEGEIGGYRVSMKADAIRRDLGEIVDLKFPMDFSIKWRGKPFAAEKHIPQMNLARLLLAQQDWAVEAGYDPDAVQLTVWDHACGLNDGPVALAVKHVTEGELLEIKPGGGEYTMGQIMEVHQWMIEQHEGRGEDTIETREKVAASLPLIGQRMFNGKKCPQYCDVEPLCSALVGKYGEPEVEVVDDTEEATG
jgi:hypothetical protein